MPKVGINALATARPLVDKCVVVKEEYIAMAILRLVHSFNRLIQMTALNEIQNICTQIGGSRESRRGRSRSLRIGRSVGRLVTRVERFVHEYITRPMHYQFALLNILFKC